VRIFFVDANDGDIDDMVQLRCESLLHFTDSYLFITEPFIGVRNAALYATLHGSTLYTLESYQYSGVLDSRPWRSHHDLKVIWNDFCTLLCRPCLLIGSLDGTRIRSQ
jgi:hypothetical protein